MRIIHVSSIGLYFRPTFLNVPYYSLPKAGVILGAFLLGVMLSRREAGLSPTSSPGDNNPLARPPLPLIPLLRDA
jgi:hypothetical protein